MENFFDSVEVNLDESVNVDLSTIPSTMIRQKIRGCIYGTAVCDALGAPLEFCRRDSKPHVNSMQINHNFNTPKGSWTDDTAMALCLLTSLCKGSFDIDDQMQTYAKWYKEGYLSCDNHGCIDIGIQIRGVLDLYLAGKKDAINEKYSRERKSGNGSLMRIAAVPAFYHDRSVEEVGKLCKLSSQSTHPSTLCQLSCQYYGSLIAAAIKGSLKEEILSPSYSMDREEIDESPSQIYDIIQRQSYKSKTRDQIHSSGFVIHSLEAALWAFHNTDSFQTGAELVVNLGDDADTVGAIYGGLAGAFYGIDAIPAEWLHDLRGKDTIDSLIDQVI